MRKIVLTTLVTSMVALGIATPAHAATTSATCGFSPITTAVSASGSKSTHPLDLAGTPDLKAEAAHQASRGSSCGTTNSMTLASASGQISWMYHYTQITNYYCGPAVVSEFSATVPGSSPYNLDQNTVASYMGTTSGGTNYQQETNGLNHFVGIPDYGRVFYGMAWMSDPPTAAQQQAFINNLSADVAVSSPIAGLAYEVAGGPHLVGHPVNQTIGHWIEIGGYNTGTSQVWYADSAQNPWPNVPAYSWFDMYTMEVILGGAGYIW